MSEPNPYLEKQHVCQMRFIDKKTMKVIDLECQAPATAVTLCSNCMATAAYLCAPHLRLFDEQEDVAPHGGWWISECCNKRFEKQQDAIVTVLL